VEGQGNALMVPHGDGRLDLANKSPLRLSSGDAIARLTGEFLAWWSRRNRRSRPPRILPRVKATPPRCVAGARRRLRPYSLGMIAKRSGPPPR